MIQGLAIDDFLDEWGPEKIVLVTDPQTGLKGIVVIDNTARGVGKGGIRLSFDITVRETFELARNVTWKAALAEVPFGGAKSGIKADSHIPHKEKIALLRVFSRRLKNLVPSEYVPGPDMGITDIEMAAFADENGSLHSCTGKPPELHGLPEKLGASGYGTVEAADVAIRFADIGLKSVMGATVAIEGFGNVGTAAAKSLSMKGAKVVAVSDTKGCIYNENGLDVMELLRVKRETNAVINYKEGDVLKKEELFGLPVEVLIPGARPDAIDDSNKNMVQAKLIVEGANIPTTNEIRREFHNKGILVMPDIIASAGGLISSYVEYINGTEEQMFTMIREKIRRNTLLIIKESWNRKEAPVDVALSIAMDRVRKAMEYRGRK